VEWYWKEKPELLREKSALVLFGPPQICFGLAVDRTRVPAVRGLAIDRLSHGMAVYVIWMVFNNTVSKAEQK
jgi:hypothetical protein